MNHQSSAGKWLYAFAPAEREPFVGVPCDTLWVMSIICPCVMQQQRRQREKFRPLGSFLESEEGRQKQSWKEVQGTPGRGVGEDLAEKATVRPTPAESGSVRGRQPGQTLSAKE